MEEQLAGRGRREWSLMLPIAGSHIERLGWPRVLAGGLAMYTCIPFLVVTHFTTAVALYQWIVGPVVGAPPVRWRDHVILDRHRIEGLPWFDRFNCLFCGYANGLCTMMNTELDHLSRRTGPRGALSRVLAALAAVLAAPFLLFAELNLQVIYNLLVSRPLGMHRTSRAEARAVLAEAGYAAALTPWLAWYLRETKSTWLRFSLALEQIESSWCPLVHFERRAGIVYPEHHARFFGPHELEAMRQTLLTRGTVSPRLPVAPARPPARDVSALPERGAKGSRTRDAGVEAALRR